MELDVGYGVDTHDILVAGGDYTYVFTENPANGSGTLDVFKIDASTGDILSLYLGVAYGSGDNWTGRDYENIGDVIGGGIQTFIGKNCTVETGDCITARWSDANQKINGLIDTGVWKVAAGFHMGDAMTTADSGALTACIYATGVSRFIPVIMFM